MTRKELLDEASRIVSTDRNATHGEPEDSFQLIADYWLVYLTSIGVYRSYKDNGGTRLLNSADVACMMTLLKLARISTSPGHQDHWVDIAGYAACGGECAVLKVQDNDSSLPPRHVFIVDPTSPDCAKCGFTSTSVCHIQ